MFADGEACLLAASETDRWRPCHWCQRISVEYSYKAMLMLNGFTATQWYTLKCQNGHIIHGILYQRSYESCQCWTNCWVLSFWSIASHCAEVLCHQLESQCPLSSPSMTSSNCYPSHEASVVPFLLMSKAGLTFIKCRSRADQAMTQSCICQLRTQSISRGSFARSPTSAQMVCCSIQYRHSTVVCMLPVLNVSILRSISCQSLVMEKLLNQR